MLNDLEDSAGAVEYCIKEGSGGDDDRSGQNGLLVLLLEIYLSKRSAKHHGLALQLVQKHALRMNPLKVRASTSPLLSCNSTFTFCHACGLCMAGAGVVAG